MNSKASRFNQFQTFTIKTSGTRWDIKAGGAAHRSGSMTRLRWQVTKTVRVGRFDLPCADEPSLAEDLGTGELDQLAIRVDSAVRLRLKRLVGPAARIILGAFKTEYIYRRLGRYIRKYVKPTDTVLDVGCGAMQLQPYLPRECWY